MPIYTGTLHRLDLLKRSLRTGRIICRCGRGYGSEYDGQCTRCRGGISAWEAQQKEKKQ